MAGHKLKAGRARAGLSFEGRYADELGLLHSALDRSSGKLPGSSKSEDRLARIRRQIHILQIISGQPMTDFRGLWVASLPSGQFQFDELPLVDQIGIFPFAVRYLASRTAIADILKWGTQEDDRFDGLYIDLGPLDLPGVNGMRNQLVVRPSHPTEIGIAMTEPDCECYAAVGVIPIGYMMAKWCSSTKDEDRAERGALLRCLGEYFEKNKEIWCDLCTAMRRMQ